MRTVAARADAAGGDAGGRGVGAWLVSVSGFLLSSPDQMASDSGVGPSPHAGRARCECALVRVLVLVCAVDALDPFELNVALPSKASLRYMVRDSIEAQWRGIKYIGTGEGMG